MAKKQLAKLSSFFEGRRRECVLTSWEVLKNKAGEKRIKVMVSMPLSRKPVLGMPESFSEQYMLMEKEESKLSLSKIDVLIESAKFEIFSTDAIASSAVDCDAAMLQDFRMVAEGGKENRKVSLEFVSYLPGSVHLRDWCWDHIHATFYCEIVPQQGTLPMAAAPVVEAEAAQPKKKGSGKQKELVN